MNTKYILTTLFFFPLLLFLWNPSENQSEQNHIHETCRALADLRIEDTNLLSAAVVPAGDELPEYCRVLGYVRPAINFEIRLPTENWNGKFYMSGCGGFCGRLSSDSDFVTDIKQPLQRQYAVSMTDAGHWGEHLFDARWAYNNRLAEYDFGYRSVPEVARVTKTMIETFYGLQPDWSYFGGCSNAGRQGVMQAMRYPEDFDGIIALDPALDLTGSMLAAAWAALANSGPDGKNLITPADLDFIRQAVYETCDSLDRLEDGLISDPRLCSFDPSILECTGGNSVNCLSQDQVRALTAIYEGPRDSEGNILAPGVIVGSEPYWEFWLTGQSDEVHDDLMRMVSEGFMRYMAFEDDPGEKFTLEDFDFDRDPARMDFMAQIYNVDNPDLNEFQKRGGKLLMTQAWADTPVSPLKTIEYYEAVEDLTGNRQEAHEFFRLFMLPGMDHCGIGEGPGIRDSGIDPLTALERWVEKGEAPKSLMMTKTNDEGHVQWTRPACPYPQQAVYIGEGDINEVSSFDCVDP